MSNYFSHTLYRALLVGVVAFAYTASAQEAPTIQVALEKDEVFVGEPFIFQIQVNNVSEAETPDLAALENDFTVEYGGGKRSSSESISITNGRTTRVVSLQYIISYRLTPKRAGRLEIPSITLAAGGQTLTTKAVTVQSSPPKANDNFRLSASLSKAQCFVGEPIIMTTKYHFNREVGDLNFTLPVLSSGDFHGGPINSSTRADRSHPEIAVNGARVIASMGEVRLGGGVFVEVTFQHTLVPKVAGTLTIPESIASAQVAVRRGLFSDYKSVVVQSEPVALSVLPLPEAEKPANFSGLVGAFALTASAAPAHVNVGDPITLTITAESENYLRHFELPLLGQQAALSESFQVLGEGVPGEIEDHRKTFTQTIRAESAAVTQIPPIELAYFDSATGRYASVATQAIPLTVLDPQIVTASDAEGFRQSVTTIEHVAVNEGIAHNFTEPDALTPQYFGPDVWMRGGSSWLLLLLPPLAWGALAGTVLIRKLGGFRPKGRARKLARAQLGQALAALADGGSHGQTLQALRAYLGAKLDANASALTFGDVERPLRAQGASDATLDVLKKIFDECEAHHYAGGAGAAEADLSHRVLACADALEKEIG